MPNNQPIGVFDSGLGGLTVVRALKHVLPSESIVYVGDTARVPYGNKSAVTVQEYARQITEFLLTKQAKLVVVACNTASALALDLLQDEFDIPIIGVIEPGVTAALSTTRNGHIGIIGTVATVTSEAYQNKLLLSNRDLSLSAQPCPLFVPLVEEGWLNGPIVEEIISTYLLPINQSSADTIILGCTHYPLLKESLQKQVKENTVLVDSADVVAVETDHVLKKYGLASALPQQGVLDCYVTDMPARFESVASRFLGSPLNDVQIIHL